MNSGADFTTSWWWDDLPESESSSRPGLPGDRDFDVVIVGGGFTGLWTAYYLTDRDPRLRIAIVEQWVVGAGASSRNGGWCLSTLPLSWSLSERRYGRSATIAWQREADATIAEVCRVAQLESIDADLAHGGYLRTAVNRAQLVELDHDIAYSREWGRSESDLRRLSVNEARQMIDSPRTLGGVFTPHCMAVQPARLVRGLARAVEARGVTIFEQTRATDITPGTVRTDRGIISADVVVRATEAYTSDLPGQRRAVLPLYSTMIATEPLTDTQWAEIGWRNRETFNDSRRYLFYAQRTRDGRIAIGGDAEVPYRFRSRIADVQHLDRVRARLRAILVDQFPSLAGVRIAYQWGGVLAMPRDWFPTVRFDPTTGFGQAGGYGGDGLSLTNLAGRTLADLITGEKSPLVTLPWVDHRNRRWEPEPLRWMEVSAGTWLVNKADRSEEQHNRPSRVYGRLAAPFIGH